jgi:outer membrane biosynthesis protein TonB
MYFACSTTFSSPRAKVLNRARRAMSVLLVLAFAIFVSVANAVAEEAPADPAQQSAGNVMMLVPAPKQPEVPVGPTEQPAPVQEQQVETPAPLDPQAPVEETTAPVEETPASVEETPASVEETPASVEAPVVEMAKVDEAPAPVKIAAKVAPVQAANGPNQNACQGYAFRAPVGRGCGLVR